MRVMENIVERQYRGLRIRVWFHRDESGPAVFDHEIALTRAVKPVIGGLFDAKETASASELVIAEQLIQHLEQEGHKVNAIEVVRDGQGSLIYPDWP